MKDVNGKNRDNDRYKVERTECGQRIGAHVILKDGKYVGKIIYHISRSGRVMVNVWDWTNPDIVGIVSYGDDNFTVGDALHGIKFGDITLPGPGHQYWYDNLRDAGYTVLGVI
jgi:hypothetical protein